MRRDRGERGDELAEQPVGLAVRSGAEEQLVGASSVAVAEPQTPQPVDDDRVSVLTTEFSAWSVAAVSLGIGTAMVYPTLLAAIGDSTLPSWRATAVGVYRLWRDSGYAFGAILAGIIADEVGIRGAIAAVGVLTLFSGFIVAVTMRPRHASAVQ